MISVAIAAYNEEDILARCLESVSEWVDEIVFVDGGSTDQTVAIAKKHGAKMIHVDNPPMFHINKQRAIDACRGDWILQLDADEVVSQELKEEILAVIGKQLAVGRGQSISINGYWIPRKNFFLGRFLKKGGQYPDYTLRFYRRGKGRLPCKSVHEQAEVEGKTEHLAAPLLHYSYPNFSHYLEHFNRYTDILAQEYADQHLKMSVGAACSYLLWQPFQWFVSTYIRHKGFQDGMAGFTFSFFSSLRFMVGYVKYWEQKQLKKHHNGQ